MTIKTAENSKREPELFQVHYYGRVIPVMAFTQRMAYADVAKMHPAHKRVRKEDGKLVTVRINPWTAEVTA